MIEEFPRFVFLILRIAVYIYILESAIVSQVNIVDIGIFVTIITLAEKNMNEFLHMLRGILREFSQISILWETFDSLDPIIGYNTGKPFKTSNQNIVIENISYSYGLHSNTKRNTLETISPK